MDISIELVPRSLEHLEQEVCTIKKRFGSVTTLNIPDLLRFETRSWQACAFLKRYVPRAIPHLRAVDIDPDMPLKIAHCLESCNLNEVVVVTGDAPPDASFETFETSSLDLIRKLREELPGVKVYAALDPYRQGIADELDYVEKKLEAGASGLFTQPFFDVRLMEVYAELLSGIPIYWGLTTVTSKRSLAYWQERNRAVFPTSFEPTLAWSRDFAKEALQFAERRDTNLYFMPIRTDVFEFLDGIL